MNYKPLSDTDLTNMGFTPTSSPGIFAETMGEQCRRANALADAAGKIPDRPSPAHRLLTPGWDELVAALALYRGDVP